VNASHAAGDGQPVRVKVVGPGYWRATFDNPPINLFDPDVFAALRVLLDRAESDEDVRVLVFDSADPDYYISHLDVDRVSEVPEIPGAANLADEWHHFVTRLASSLVLSIASIRGRVRGIGTEFVLACDMRFASAETAILAQPEVGFGVVPGGGGLDWLPRLTGRCRALEIITGAQDFDAGTAERYGWINRALPDQELDGFVDELATASADSSPARWPPPNAWSTSGQARPARANFSSRSRPSSKPSPGPRHTPGSRRCGTRAGASAPKQSSITPSPRFSRHGDSVDGSGTGQAMTDLLRLVLDAHGGLDRWHDIGTLTVHARVGGELWGRRGQEGVLAEARLDIDPHAQRLIFHDYPATGRRGVFDMPRTRIETDDGQVIGERADPAAALSGQTTTTQWDHLDIVYTAGFDLWGYFTTPFCLAMSGVRTEEIEPWSEAGEQWRRLRAAFPEGFAAHGRQQVYAFNSSGLLRRFEYKPKLGGVPANVNYAAEHRDYGGLLFPVRRRMLPADPDGRSRPEPALMTIDVLDIHAGPAA
jgi:enoyl-CoA hydratase/carnithine racemase